MFLSVCVSVLLADFVYPDYYYDFFSSCFPSQRWVRSFYCFYKRLEFALRISRCSQCQSHSRCVAFVLHYRLAAPRHQGLPEHFRNMMHEGKAPPHLIKWMVRIWSLISARGTEKLCLGEHISSLLVILTVDRINRQKRTHTDFHVVLCVWSSMWNFQF